MPEIAQPLKILLVEVNTAEAELMTNELTGSPFGPFVVTHVSHLADAIGQLRSGRAFDGILLELGLPDSHGLTTLEQLRQHAPRDIPIVVLTGLEDENLRLQALRVGAEDYLGKNESPVSMRCRAIRCAIERKRARAAAEASEQRLTMAVEAAQLGIFEWDLKTGQINLFFHQARLFGFSPDEFDGTIGAIEQRVHSSDRARMLESIRRAIEARGECQCEYRVIWPDKSEHWIETNARVLCDDNGLAARMMGIVMDVSHRKAAEEAAAIRATQSSRLAAAKLTVREVTLLKMLAAGLPSKRIAADLKISIRTVAKHRSNLMAKTKAHNAADLARMTALAGVLPK